MTVPIQQDPMMIPVQQEMINPLTNILRFLQSTLRRKWILVCWMGADHRSGGGLLHL